MVWSGFSLSRRQTEHQQKEKSKDEHTLATTAYHLMYDAFNLVCCRLNNAYKKGELRYLQMAQTTEMIDTMRDFQIAHVSADMLHYFIQIRSQLVAINMGINNFYENSKDEEKLISSYRVIYEAKRSWSKFNVVARSLNIEGTKDCPLKEYPELQRKSCQEWKRLKKLREELQTREIGNETNLSDS